MVSRVTSRRVSRRGSREFAPSELAVPLSEEEQAALEAREFLEERDRVRTHALLASCSLFILLVYVQKQILWMDLFPVVLSFG